jgi:ribosomal-protein-alanine N-acetyltransferase
MADFPILTTQRLTLRQFRAADAPALLAIFSREVVTRYHNRERVRTIEEAQELATIHADAWGKGLGARWAITRRDGEDEVIGSCGYYNVNRAYRSVEICYDLHPTYWRQGIMSETLTAMLAYCFGQTFEFRLNRVEALAHVAHVASIGLLGKLGFQEEGIRREYGFWKNQFHDLRSFSLLRRDWDERLASGSARANAPFDLRNDVGQIPGAGPAPSPQRSGLRGWIL